MRRREQRRVAGVGEGVEDAHEGLLLLVGPAGAVRAGGGDAEQQLIVVLGPINEDGLATQLTAGYVMDRAVGNTEGLGGVFGLLWAIGKSPFKFPEGRPWKPSLRYRLFMWFGALAAKFQKKKE